jgi:hypothetical protein
MQTPSLSFFFLINNLINKKLVGVIPRGYDMGKKNMICIPFSKYHPTSGI